MLTAQQAEALGLDVEGIFAPFVDEKVIGLAISGGPDSMAMLALAHLWTQGRSNRLITISVDHGLRPEAAAEVARVGEVCRSIGLPFVPLKWTGTKPKTGIQAAAREARYRLMGQAMRHEGASVLFTAHHLDDQAETLLMRLAHKSGLTGLSGMRPIADMFGIRVARPLLTVPQATLRDVVAATGWTVADDATNRDARFERVRWRGLMPKLAEHGLDAKALGLFSQRMARANDALEWASLEALSRVARLNTFGIATIQRAEFASLPAEFRVRMLGRVLRDCGGGAGAPELAQIEDLVGQIEAGENRVSTLAGCRVEATASRLEISREVGRDEFESFTLAPDGSLVWDQRFEVLNRAHAHSFVVESANSTTRAELEAFWGAPLDHRMIQFAGTPVVRNDQGELVAVGLHGHDDRIVVRPKPKPPYFDAG